MPGANAATIKITIDVDGKTGVATIRQLGDESKKAGEKGDKAFKKSDQSLGDYNRTAGSAVGITGKLAGAFAGLSAAAALGGTVKLLKEGVLSLAEWERKMLRTDALIRATGNAAGISSGDLADFAKQLDLATLGSRDEIMDAVNAMQTFRAVSGDTFKRAIVLSQDLAEVLGTGMRSQAVQLGKALQDPVQGLTALARVGVTFTDQQKDQIKALVENNRQLEAQARILDEIERQVGGSATGAAGGLAGKMDTLSFQWKDFNEALTETSTVASLASWAIDGLSGSLAEMSKNLRGPTIQESMQTEITNLNAMLKLYEMTGGRTRIDPNATRQQIANLQEHLFRNIDRRPLPATPAVVKMAALGMPTAPGNPWLSYQTELGAVGAERGHIASAQMAADSADFVKRAQAEYDGLMVGATDSFMGLAAANERAMEMMKETTVETADVMKDAFTGWASSYAKTLNDMLWDSEITFDGILESFGRMVTQMIIQQSMSGVAGYLTSLVPSAKGNVFAGPGISAYENQIVNRPTLFAFANGGVMGEGGRPEAVMPLVRTPSGDLGVQSNAAPANIQINLENRSGVDLEPEIRIMQPSPGRIIANAVLNRKINSRSWRQSMGVK